MLNVQLMTEKDRREAAKINKRRAAEEERKKRIFNPRARLIGIDEVVLEQQINEKKKRDFEQQQIDKIFNEQLQKADQIAVKLCEKEKQERLKLEQEINNFRRTYQKKEDRREFDLNDPDQIKKQLPARLHDDDPRCGPSSAQKFIGEDALSEQRTKVQKEQFKASLDQQVHEKEQADKERKAAKEAYEAAVIARDQRAIELDLMEKKCRKQIQESYTRFNQALAIEKCNEMEKLKNQSIDDNWAEIYNTITSDMLTENPDAAQSNLGPGRKIAYQSKGMTDEQKKEIKKIQLAQIEEAKKRKELDSRQNREFEEYINGTQRSIHIMDLELERKKKEMLKKIAEENKKLAEEQKLNKDMMKKMVFTNRMSDDFFEQFNKSTR